MSPEGQKWIFFVWWVPWTVLWKIIDVICGFLCTHTFIYNYLIMFTVYEYVHVYIELGNHIYIYISRAWCIYIYMCLFLYIHIYIHFIFLWHTLTLQHLHIYFNYILLSSYSLKVDTSRSRLIPTFMLGVTSHSWSYRGYWCRRQQSTDARPWALGDSRDGFRNWAAKTTRVSECPIFVSGEFFNLTLCVG